VRADNADNPRSKFPAEKWRELAATVDDGTGGTAPLGAPVFGCHKGAPGTGADMACAGWLAMFGDRHVAIRMAIAMDRLPAEALAPKAGWPPLYTTWEAMAAAQTLRPGDPTDHLGGCAMTDPPIEERWMKGEEVKALFEVSYKTLLRWDTLGKLPTTRTPQGHRRWRQHDVEAVRAGRPLPTRDADGRVVAESAVPARQTAVDGRSPGGGE
jgi:hypothetical protein